MTALSIPALEYKTLGATLAAPTTSTPTGDDGNAVVVGYDDVKGTVDAVVAVTGTRDEVGDIITPGAFKSSIQARHPKMCLGHDWNRPIGWPIDYKELSPGDPGLPTETADGKPWPAEAGGLWTRNQYMLDTQDGRDAYAHAKFYGNKTAYSIGYVVTKSRKTLVDGLPTRIIDALDLYEYGPVLHGAHPLATQQSVKSAAPQGIENKVRLVHDAHYWGLPMGTPIHPGMKPRGAKAQKLERAGHAVSETEGAVDIPNDKLRIKPTARGKAKFRSDGALRSQLFGEIMSKIDEGEAPEDFSVDDPNGLNKKEGEYNPLDLMVANGVTPAEMEDTLRNANWDDQRLGDSADNQDQINTFVDDVVGVYREKYNEQLVKQNGNKDTATVADPTDTGADPAGVEGPTPDAPDTTAPGDANVGDTAPAAPEAAAPQTPQAPEGQTAPTASAAAPEQPKNPGMSTTKLTTLPKRDAAAAVGSMSDQDLAAHDTEMASRATQLGRDGQVSPNHQVVKDELAKRVANPKPQTSAASEPAAPAANVPAAPAAAPSAPAAAPTKLRKLTPKASAAIGAAAPGMVDHRTTDASGNIDYSGPTEPKSGLVVQGNANMVHALAKNGLAHPYSNDPNKAVLTPEGEKHHHAINGTTPPTPDGGTESAAPSAPTMSTDKLASLDKQRAATAVAGMSDQELAGHDQELGSRAEQLGKAGQVTPNHQAVKDEIARRPAPEPGGIPPTAAEGAPGAPVVPGAPGEGPHANAVAAETLRSLPRDSTGRVDLVNAPTALVQTLRQAGIDDSGGAEQNEQSFTSALDALDQQYGQDPAMAHALATARGFVTGDAPNAKVIQRQAATDAKQFQTDAETPVGDRADAARALASALNKSGMAYMADPSGNMRDSRPIPNALSKYAQALISYHGALPPAKVEKPAGAPGYTPTGDASRLGELTDSQLAAEIGSAQSKLDEIVRADPRRESGQHADAKLKLNAFQGEHSRRQQAGETHPDEPVATGTGGETPNPEAPSEPSTQDGQPPVIPGSANETGIPAPAEPPHSDVVPTPQEAAQISADEQGDAEEIGDTAQGVVESDDGEFEVEPDIADRQDRIASLLGQSDAGNLDLGSQDDDQLRSTRGDIVNELKLQQYLDARNRQRANPQPTTPEPPQPPQGAAPASPGAPEHTGTQTPPGAPAVPPPPVETGPPPQRPGVAGAAEDFADAIESGDSGQIDAARARLASSLRRSKTDAASVGALRELASGDGDPSAEDLRASAQTVRTEVRERRNASARSRRTARRFERDRLRNLLHQVEGEMDRRHLRYDPVPEDSADGAPVSPWNVHVEKFNWSNTGSQVHEIHGANYDGKITVSTDANNNPHGDASFTWTVRGDDGTVLAQGNGITDSPDHARDAVAVALRAQQTLGNVPPDASIPEPSTPSTTSARPHDEVTTAVSAMHQRLSASERAVNPVTGAPDPLGKRPALRPPTTPAFDSVDKIREHLTSSQDVHEGARAAMARVQWDNVKLTPGANFMVVTRAGETGYDLIHTSTGRSTQSIAARGSGNNVNMGASDLLAAGALLESLPDDNGTVLNWATTDNNAVLSQISGYTVGDQTGIQALSGKVMNTLAGEKIRDGQWSSPVVRAMSSSISPYVRYTNRTRTGYTQQNHDALTAMLTPPGGRPAGEDRETLNVAGGAQTLNNLGAPDAAAVLLRRRSAELRDTYGADANAHGASTLDNLAGGYLSLHSPVASPGERALSIKPGERITVAGDDKASTRTFRMVSTLRQEGQYGGASASVMDESSGEVMRLHIGRGFGGTDQLTITPNGNTYPSVRVDLGSPTFTVTSPDEPVPATPDDLHVQAMDDANAIPADVLDAVANVLPPSKVDSANRRALPAEQRPARRGSPRRPRQTAPTAQPAGPVVGEQHLAASQASAKDQWVGDDFALSDDPAPGGFDSLEAWRTWAKDAATDPSLPDKVRQSLTNALVDDTYLPQNGAQLSPGGHFIVFGDGRVIYARAAQTIFPSNLTPVDVSNTKWSPAVGMEIAGNAERATWGGRTVRWGDGHAATIKDLGALVKTLGDSRYGTVTGKGDPLLSPAKLAFANQVVNAKTPRVGDVDGLETLATFRSPLLLPNPDVIGAADLPGKRNIYLQLGGRRATSYSAREVDRADTKAGQNLANRVAGEMRIAQSLHQVAPLDAARRLNRVADEIDGQKITTVNGESHDPAAEMRSVAKAIADAYDETKVTPFGRFMRAGSVGLIVPKSAPKVTKADGTSGYEPRRAALAEMMAQGMRFSREQDGAVTVRFGDTGVTTSRTPGQFNAGYVANGKPIQGGIGIQSDGSITMRWRDPLTSITMSTTLPSGSFDFEDPTSEE